MSARTRGLRHLLAAALTVVGVGLLVAPATAAGTVIAAGTPTALAVAASQATVADGDAQAITVVATDAGLETFAAAAALAATPAPSALLLSPADRLPAPVRSEIMRVAGPSAVVHLVGAFDAAVGASLEASGLVVDAVNQSDARATATALADQTFGVPAGTNRRVLIVADDQQAWAAAGVAAVYGVNVGVPVVPLGSENYDTEVPLREVVVVAAPDVLPDDRFADLPDDPAVTRVWEQDPSALAIALADLLMEEPRDGDLQGPEVVAPVAVDINDGPYAAAVAATVASERILAGMLAPLYLVDGAVPADPAAACEAGEATPTSCELAAATGTVTTVDLLGAAAAAPEPTAPLPTTGGGAAALVGALLLLAAGGSRGRGAGRPGGRARETRA